MTEPNINNIGINNPIFQKDSNSEQTVEYRNSEDQGLIGLKTNAVRNFAQEYARRFYGIKIAIWAFLLLTAIFTTILTNSIMNFNLKINRWSNWFTKTGLPHISEAQLSKSEDAALIAWIMVIFATASLIGYRQAGKNIEKSKMLLSSMAIKDIVLSVFFIVNLLVAFLNFALRSVSEYIWFYPRLTNGTSLAELTEYNRRIYIDRGYNPYWNEYKTTTTTVPPSTTFSPYQTWEMETRKRELIARLIMDPITVVIVLLAIILNIVHIFRIRSAIKRTNLWVSEYPESSPLGVSYSKFWTFGILKIATWVIPVFLILAPLYGLTSTYDFGTYILAMTICACVCLERWIRYIQKVRFQTDEIDVKEQEERLKKDIAQDLVVYGFGVVFYVVLYNILHWQADLIKKVSVVAIFVFLCCIGGNIYLLRNHGGIPKLNMKIPCISINVTINEIKESPEAKINTNAAENEEKTEKSEEFCANV